MKVLLPFLWGGTYMLEEMPIHIHSKTEEEGSKKASYQLQITMWHPEET